MKDSARLPSLDEAALVDLARALAPALAAGGVVYLRGDLGAGKTTFARALLQALGVGERVKSPTYSLIESYRAGGIDIHHLDLYRIADPGELEWLGLDALWRPGALVLVEWPQRGGDRLPPADLELSLAHTGIRRDLLAESGGSVLGRDLVARLSEGCPSLPSKDEPLFMKCCTRKYLHSADS